jgi:HPt (histidine-containing phosphotransfer) domain-containing protein
MAPAAQPGPPPEASLREAVDHLWDRFLPEIRERVAVLAKAAEAVAVRKLTAEQRRAAQSAAHKLSGVLGTFGLTRGTVLARELEMTFSRESAPGADASQHLAALTAELHTMVENRSSAGSSGSPIGAERGSNT